MVWKAILLSGHPGCGKTTVILKLLSKFRGVVGGFYTQEIRHSGVREGFEIVTLNGEKDILAHVNFESSQRIGKYGVNIRAIDALAVRAVKDALRAGGLVVIDEIGPMEIRSLEFRQVVMDVFQHESKLIGTIARHHIPFLDVIKQRQDVNLIQVRPDNRDRLPDQILELLVDRENQIKLAQT